MTDVDGVSGADGGPEPEGEPLGDSMADRVHRATVEFGLDVASAERLEAVVDAAGDVPDELGDVVDALGEPDIAEAAWTRWSDDGLLGEPLDTLIDRLAELDGSSPGVTWLRARHLTWHGHTAESIELLEAARASGDRLVLADIAAVEADRSDAAAARELLREAGADVDIDLDTAFDPFAADRRFAQELAEEIAPFAMLRPKPMAGRNDRCPCGSGKKYKQCHLGRELHPIEDRAGWLYVKLMRFMQVNAALLPAAIGDDIVDAVTDPELRQMVLDSYLTVDLALFEGGVAQRFLDTRGSLLPPDEAALLESWIAARRSVFEVERSRGGAMDVIDVATRERKTVVDTVPDLPLEAGWKIIGRLVPVGDGYRAYSGFLPVNDDMVASMTEAFASEDLETVTLAIGQIFETAATQDDLRDAFDEGLDMSALDELLAELGDAVPTDDEPKPDAGPPPGVS